MNYLFGYGSLISQHSRQRTGQTGKTLPVRIMGAERAWNVRSQRMTMTAVGLVLNETATCNGVLVEIAPSEIPFFDKREGPVYERVEVAADQVSGLNTGLVPVGTIWTYVVRKPRNPSMAFPIVQSYVDVVLSGCLEFGLEFASEFIRTTTGWEHGWCDDRSHPRYVRSEQNSDRHLQIDTLLARFVPKEFAQRIDNKS